MAVSKLCRPAPFTAMPDWAFTWTFDEFDN
jgi:hypothetical protein